ncbi:SAM (and some other nucleotide) binding motif:Generic methyl-transferase [Geminocystis sp. NIES-3708]|uniref:class I SAM-dependent methyltransferase n=1 Tax=Geminocystis sp. NIES-3708 TaxID=1615909 RepID=UPI0005FC8AB4|nr:class I SAM-dependent methyltransferase [Geminocystis sp. NIES-3708]BAQ62179.1 SAM (and some other nucleotide) binding motif:Generic methyl-transferase [Geminocystis sp. NIES-3708]
MNTTTSKLDNNFSIKLINGLLNIKPLMEFAKTRARSMIIKRANLIGVGWENNVKNLQNHDWQTEIQVVENPDITYPSYYLTSFHAYDHGNLSWEAAWELESASYSVHSTVYSKTPQADGDRNLRESYNQVLKSEIISNPENILDFGCGVGLSTFALQENYPQSNISGLDLSPYFLSVANYQSKIKNKSINWIHSAAELTNLPVKSFDLISAFLMFHELPQSAAENIILSANKLLKKGGYFGIMDMNPQSENYQKMPRYVLTLLKSTEPYLDEYFTLDIASVFEKCGFSTPKIIPISPRHRAIIAQKVN